MRASALRAGCAGLLLASAARAQIVTENAGVVSPELTIVREQLGLARAENLDEVCWSHHLVVAPDRANELRLTVPVVWRTARFEGAGGAEEAHLAGLGDVTLRYKRALARADEVMASERWALLLELGAPTGESDATAGGSSVPRALQLGGGGWTLGAGGAATWVQDRRRVSVEAFYRHRTRHDGVQLGASADLFAAWWYRIRPVTFAPGQAGAELRAVLELLGRHQFPGEEGSETLDDDGSIVWLAPGVHWYPRTNLLFEANVQVPLVQDIDDALGERRWSANLVVKFLL
jgi:hypothetical protein